MFTLYWLHEFPAASHHELTKHKDKVPALVLTNILLLEHTLFGTVPGSTYQNNVIRTQQLGICYIQQLRNFSC